MDIGMDQVLNADEVIENFGETFVSIYRIKKYITNITNITLFGLVMVNWALVFLIQGVARVIVILVHALSPLVWSSKHVNRVVLYCQGLLLHFLSSP